MLILILSLLLIDRPPLVEAARTGDRDTLRALVQKSANVNAKEADGTTALHWASYRDDLEAANLLIRAGAKVNVANDLGVTPLWSAGENGSEPMVRRLLEAGANPNMALLLGETPLMVASRAGNAAIVQLLLNKGAKVNARAARGQTALMWAVGQKHSNVVKVLLAGGADVHARSEAWTQVMAVTPHGHLDYNRDIPHGSDTALMFAARSGDLASAKLLVAAGANVNDADAWGVSAVTMAAHSGHADVLEFLLEKSADPNAAKAGFSALHVAIMRRDEKMVAALLARGADPNAPLKTWTPTRRSSNDYNFAPELVGTKPFWLAARQTQPNVMRLLLKHGADPLFVHKGEWLTGGITGNGFQNRTSLITALMAAVGMGGGDVWFPPEPSERESLTLEAAKIAVELGIDVNAANTDGRTALDGARTLKYESVIKFLTDRGAKSGTAK